MSSSTSTTSDGTTTETKTESKDIFKDSSQEAVTQKKIMPKLEGAIVIAEGARRCSSESKYYICNGCSYWLAIT